MIEKFKEFIHPSTRYKKELSPELEQLLKEEAIEAEIQSAVDAALEEGFVITREEAISFLIQMEKQDKDSSPQK